MKKNSRWDIEARSSITQIKFLLANLSIFVRTDQFNLFRKYIRPNFNTKVLDVGVTSDELLKDSNMFEKLYPWQRNLVAATIEDPKAIKKLYPKLKRVIQIKRLKKLPFKNKQFDVAVSWATLEHTGTYKEQEFFLSELQRIAKKIFVTTPFRGALYEPHSGFFFLHWLPLTLFRGICRRFNKEYWSDIEHLNPLWVSDIANMKLRRNPKIKIYKTFKLLSSHIIITG